MTNPMCSICGEHANEHLAIAGHQFQSSPEPRPLKELLTKIRDAFEAERDSRKQWRGDDELGIDYKSPHVRDAWFNFRDGWLGAVSTHEPPAGPPWTFDRYQQGRLMAEGITINRETTFQAALLKAVRMADRLDVLVLRAAQPPAPEHFDIKRANELGDAIVQRVCEIPDRTSPDDEPDALTCSPSELHNCVVAALESEFEHRTGRSCLEQPTATKSGDTYRKLIADRDAYRSIANDLARQLRKSKPADTNAPSERTAHEPPAARGLQSIGFEPRGNQHAMVACFDSIEHAQTARANFTAWATQPPRARDADLYEWVSGLVEALPPRAKDDEHIDSDYLAELYSRLSQPPLPIASEAETKAQIDPLMTAGFAPLVQPSPPPAPATAALEGAAQPPRAMPWNSPDGGSAIHCDPNLNRISLRFERREEYEAMVALLDCSGSTKGAGDAG